LSPALCRLLANPQIVKAGVALDRDVQELNKLAPFTPAGFVDVGELAKRAGCMHHGLRGLATLLLGFRVSKSSQTSNWANATLTPAQIEYAATDAWVGRELYHKLQSLLPPRAADEPATNESEPEADCREGES
jgi:ribonuclease D